MVVTGFVLIALGLLLGLFFPVMFVAALAGAIVLALGFFGGAKRTTEAASGTEHRPE